MRPSRRRPNSYEKVIISLLVVLMGTVVVLSCTGVPSGKTSTRDASPDADSDTDDGFDTESESGDEHAGDPMPTCWGTSLDSAGINDGVVDTEVFPSGESLAATMWGTLYVHSSDGSLLRAVQLWAAQFGNEVKAVETLSDNGYVVLGRFVSDLTLAASTPQEVTLHCDVQGGVVLARYSAGDDLVWARRLCNVRDDEISFWSGYGLGALSDGSIIMGGAIPDGYVVFGEGEENETILETTYDPYAGNRAIFIARYLENGALGSAWIIAIGRSISREIAALPVGSFALSGMFNEITTLGAGQENETTLAWSAPPDAVLGPTNCQGQHSNAAFVAKYASDGTLQWADGINASCFDHAAGDSDVTNVTSLADGAIAVSGRFLDALEFANGTVLHGFVEVYDDHVDWGPSMFIARWGSDGSLQWTRGTCAAGPGYWYAYSSNIIEMPAGDLVIAGAMHGNVDFKCELGAAPKVIGEDQETLFVASFEQDGGFAGVWRIGDGWEDLTLDQDVSLASTGADAFLLGGTFEGAPVIDGAADVDYTLTGDRDGFLIKACP